MHSEKMKKKTTYNSTGINVFFALKTILFTIPWFSRSDSFKFGPLH